MKITYTIRLFFIMFAVYACTGEVWASDGGRKTKKEKQQTNHLIFQLQNPSGRHLLIDSALIVLDKYDLTGAGEVIMVIPPDAKNRLILADVPVGKYYVGIYTYGVCRQYISSVIEVTPYRQKHRPNRVKINITDTERYTKNGVVIPPEDLRRFTYVKF